VSCSTLGTFDMANAARIQVVKIFLFHIHRILRVGTNFRCCRYKPWYLEECSSTLATTYSSGTPGRDKSVATVDMDGRLRPGYICTTDHTGKLMRPRCSHTRVSKSILMRTICLKSSGNWSSGIEYLLSSS